MDRPRVICRKRATAMNPEASPDPASPAAGHDPVLPETGIAIPALAAAPVSYTHLTLPTKA